MLNTIAIPLLWSLAIGIAYACLIWALEWIDHKYGREPGNEP